MEYFVRNCVLHRSMQNKHRYLEHEMKYFFKALAKEPKKVVAMLTHPFFQVQYMLPSIRTLQFNIAITFLF